MCVSQPVPLVHVMCIFTEITTYKVVEHVHAVLRGSAQIEVWISSEVRQVLLERLQLLLRIESLQALAMDLIQVRANFHGILTGNVRHTRRPGHSGAPPLSNRHLELSLS